FKTSVEDTQREKELLERIRSNSPGLINAEFIEKIYIEIMKESKELQKGDRRLIAFKGEHGAYGEVASRVWNSDLVSVQCNEYSDVFEGVKSGLYDFGIVPVENSLGGIVGEVNELLINTDLFVTGAVELPIYLSLLVLPGTDHREIRSVYSNSQSLTQCHNFLARNNLAPVQYYDTAGAAKMLAEKTPKSSAVVASSLAAEIYDLEVIKEDIDDFERNMRRYLILSKEESRESGDKCTVKFSTAHRAGTLFSVLEVFAREDINLTRIGSIPTGKGNYAFFVDLLGSGTDEVVAKALREVEELTAEFRLMGYYKEKRAE
ncbi:bifunctional chorismate mutase/prephenate dehydratase, partial [Thermodesulfobacteriota bacterium]